MNISLPAEVIFHLFGFPITNSMLTSVLIALILIGGALTLRLSFKKVPGRFQSLIEMVYLYFYNSAVTVLGREDVIRELFPYLMTLFFFALFSNWWGLLPVISNFGLSQVVNGQSAIIPILRAPTSDLNTTAALALISVFLIEYMGIKYSGAKAYAGKFFNFKTPLAAFTGAMELVSELSRIISFTFRIFGNIFGGEVLISVVLYLTYSLVPYFVVAPLPFMLLEVFIGLLQAYIYAFLVLIFVSLAVTSHSEGHGGEELGIPNLVAQSEHQIESKLFHHST